jgi:SAM-dependent methyltransferase
MTHHLRPTEDAATAEVAGYYDSNTGRFLLMGGGAPSMHRALWAPGVDSARSAAGHVDRILADEIAALALGPIPAILDFGCGVGGTLLHVAERFRGARLTGVTISGKQVERARRLARRRGLAERCEFVLGDFQSVDLGRGADVVVAVESFVHAASTDAFLANAVRHLGEQGRLMIVDDFLASAQGTLDARQRRRVEQLRSGWRVPSLCSADDLVVAAARHGLGLERRVDLTPLTRPGSRLRDRFTAIASPLMAGLGLARMPFCGNLIGGNALQIGLREGFLRYQLLTFRKLEQYRAAAP